MGTIFTTFLETGISNLVAVILDTSGQWWNTDSAAFEAYVAANIGDYGIDATEHGATGIYQFTFPSGITTAGIYTVYIVDQSGTGDDLRETDFPAVASGIIEWGGSAILGLTDITSKTDTIGTGIVAAS